MKNLAYIFQAVLISLWWLGMVLNNSFRNAFGFEGTDARLISFFVVPDFVVLVLLSLLRAYKREKWMEYLILGGFFYAALLCLNISIITKSGLLPTALMLLGLGFNVFIVFSDQLFVESRHSDKRINALKTFVQIVLIWTLTLFVIPSLLLNAAGKKVELNFDYLQIGSALLFILFSSLGLYSSYHLVKYGSGTPLPLDQTQKLVISGPYRHVRNPMAVAGIGQGLAVSLFSESYIVLFYVLLGAFVWHWFVRPMEEEDMYKRFGTPYDQYKKSVRCWIPRW
ncbi:MAG: isoprenylcysteine carboxylmethyltransferase family protein [Saprospiraceae bacterium]|nr:isoprenylcysteine carboxylmethyltransferase family protein [Saprospiraceae bacterium]